MAYQAKIPCYLCLSNGSDGNGKYRCETCHKKVCDHHSLTVGSGYGSRKVVYCSKCNPYILPRCSVCQQPEDAEGYFPFVTCRRCGKRMCKSCQHSHNISEHHNVN